MFLCINRIFIINSKQIPMKKILILSLTLFFINGIAQENSYKATKIWASPEILTTSESVCYDDNEKVLYVACIDGNPTEKDGNGFISRLSLSGDIIMLKWATGLNAPKGMGISNGLLYVSDIDRVVSFNLSDSKFVKEYEVKEAQFLNDICVGDKNVVFISDMASNNIYTISNDKISLWISDARLEKPNGLNYKEGELLIGTRNGIFGAKVKDKSLRHIVKDTGGIDGLELFEEGYYLISDWSGKVQLVHPSKEAIVLLNTTELGINAADIKYLAERKQLFIPTFMDNRVTAYEIIKD